MRINSVIRHFLSLVTALLFSANCLISLIRSNRIRLSVFSRQTLRSTGGVSQCTFHLFLMAGPSGFGLRSPLPLAHSGLSLHSPPLRLSPDGEGKQLEVEVILSLSMILLTADAAIIAPRAGCLMCSVPVVKQGSSLN